MNPHLHVLVMAGGSGTRFWPLSRRGRPKQFLALTSAASLLEETVERARELCPARNLWVLTRAGLGEAVRELLPQLPPERLVVEPEARDTAPCLTLAAARVAAVDPQAVLLVMPADHRIDDSAAFTRCVTTALSALADRDGLYTFGIRPTAPATGFGYIRRLAGSERRVAGEAVYAVESFREKPPLHVAESYLADGAYYWNAGIFLWRLETFLTALAATAPALRAGYDALRALGAELTSDPCGTAATQCFGELPRLSIDYALLEHARERFVVEASFPWDDVGSWQAVQRYAATDGAGNALRGDVLAVGMRDTTVLSQGGRLVALVGVEGLIVVDTPDALLVVPRERAEEVKQVVERLATQGRTDLL